MPRLKNAVPKYRKHKQSGQAIVTLNGRDYLLGPHGTKTSKLEYDRLIGEWLVNGRQMPVDSEQLTVVELCVRYWEFAKSYYVKDGKPTRVHHVMLAELAKANGIYKMPGVSEDVVPAPPDEATTQHGDLWILGGHRLLCGDSSKAEDVDRLLDGAAIQLVNTDPPYNVKVEPRSNNAIVAGHSSFEGNRHHQGSTSPGTRRSRSLLRKSFEPRIARWQTTSSRTRRSTSCSTPGSATSPACWSPAAHSISGAAMPTAPTIRRC